MIDGGNGLTSWFMCFRKNKLTMSVGPSPIFPLDQLAESKVKTFFVISVQICRIRIIRVLFTYALPSTIANNAILT
jgi:hypothetical protein